MRVSCLSSTICILSTLFLFSCSTPGKQSMVGGKLRPIDATYDITYKALESSFESLELEIKRKEKSAGILTAIKQEWCWGIWNECYWEGVSKGFSDPFSMNYDETFIRVFLTPSGKNQTKLRIEQHHYGDLITDQDMVDQIWTLTQREALKRSGKPVPHELEQLAQDIKN